MGRPPRRGQGRATLASFSMGAIELSSRNPVKRSNSAQAQIMANYDNRGQQNINKYLQGLILCIMAVTVMRMGSQAFLFDDDRHRRTNSGENSVRSVAMGTFDLSEPSVNSAFRVSAQMDIVEKSAQHIEPPSDIKAAVCFKTLFGDVDLRIVLQWAAYNRLLGFDRVHIFYREEIKSKPYWKTLAKLPYVSLYLNDKGSREDYYAQWWTEKQCLENYASKMDFVMLADMDEYLRLPKKYNGIKQFLSQYKKEGKTYLSFGKYMYTLDHQVENSDPNLSNFEVSNYPFYMKYFCYGRRKGKPNCPNWKGRAKVIVDPKVHQRVNVHGTYYHPNRMTGGIHFHPDQAHFMEWPNIFNQHNITKRKPIDFEISKEEEVHIHNLQQAFNENENGRYSVLYDSELSNWFKSVLNRANSISIS